MIDLTKKYRFLILFVSLFVILCCGVPPSQRPKSTQAIKDSESTGTATTTPVTNEESTTTEQPRFTLRLFGAPWCQYCNEEISEINEHLNTDFKGLKDRIDVVVSAEYGANSISEPTIETTEAWKQKLNTPFKFILGEYKLKYYKKFFDPKLGIPAAIIFKPSGEVEEKYAGKRTDEILAKLREVTKRGRDE